jgi:hypothetical protein
VDIYLRILTEEGVKLLEVPSSQRAETDEDVILRNSQVFAQRIKIKSEALY